MKFVRMGVIAATVIASVVWVRAQSPSDPTAPTMVYEGFTEPHHDIMVAATEIGRLESLEVRVGDRVQAGQVIGQLEDGLQSAAVKIAEMQTTMTGELRAAQAEFELNQLRVNNLRRLFNESAARSTELLRAEADYKISASRQLAAEEDAKLRQLELERYRLQLERRKIRSPMSGVIAKVFHKPGEYITPSEPAVVRLLVMDKLFAVFAVPVEDVADVKPGAPVSVYLRSLSLSLDATISSIAPVIDGESGTVQVRVSLDNASGRLLAGDRCALRLKESVKSARSTQAGLRRNSRR